ncbi:MAG: hypothetical protein VXY70_02360, partial [Actinomycetota bacterium]|nr:hypothetical protein [Actinomycetota bacterium]
RWLLWSRPESHRGVASWFSDRVTTLWRWAGLLSVGLCTMAAASSLAPKQPVAVQCASCQPHQRRR